MKRAAIFLILFILLGLGCAARAVDAESDQKRRYTGELIVVIADHFEQMTSKMHYHLLPDTGGPMIPLKLNDRREMPELASGLRVEIVGRKQDGAIAVESIRILEAP
jgi:hypothetical protein